MDWNLWTGKYVFIKLRSGEVYNGQIINTDSYFLEIITKYNEHIAVSCNEIIKVVDDTNKIKRGKISP